VWLTVQEAIDGVGNVVEAGCRRDGIPCDAVAAHGRRGDGGAWVGGADERGVGGDLDEAAWADQDGAELEQREPLPRPLRDGRLDVEEGDLGPTGARESLRRRCHGLLLGRGHGGRRRHFCLSGTGCGSVGRGGGGRYIAR
jgi:hypothetical protein